jgi:uncharacterized protein YrrD
MSITSLSQELKGKTIVSITNGAIVGEVVDVLIDPGALQVAALVTSKGGLLKRGETEAILAKEVRVWGYDVILISGPDVVVKEEELPGLEKWLSAADQIRGYTVVSTDGTRIGELNDVMIDAQGQVVAYDLARVFVKGPVAESKRIATELTHSLGPDVLIVDASHEAETE